MCCVMNGEELLAHLDSRVFEYTELEDWYEAMKRKKELTVSLQASQDIIFIILSLSNFQTLIQEFMKEGKINKRTIKNGKEICDVYWLCYSNEKVYIYTWHRFT